mmetsp:Transcript_10685/g.25197  ORF Transcript_10685/g.25197 Transcript_10685/m.25197 type:complete len:260 (+) Transcript_10685:87-866(+)
MLGQLVFRGTFITLEEEPEGSRRRVRALSAPSRSLQASEALEHDWQQKNVELQNYVGGLLAEPTFGETPEASESEEDMASGNDEENPGLQDDDAVGVRLNEGSLGHPGLCRRPCVHFAKAGSCLQGTACTFCHLPHTRERKLDKWHRGLLHQIDKTDYLRLLQQVIWKKSTSLSFPRKQELIDVLEHEIEVAEMDRRSRVRSRSATRAERSTVVRRLSCMSLGALVSIAARECQPATQDALWQILDEVRYRTQTGKSTA